MEIFLLVISILLIILVLLQSGKAEGASQAFSGGQENLLTQRKERGSELVLTRVTFVLGMTFFTISLVSMFL